MAKKRIEQYRNGKQFVKHARKQGASLRNGKGSHTIVQTERGSCVVPCHAKDLGKGIRISIMKTFIKIGLAAFVLWTVVLPFLMLVLGPA